MRRFIALLVLAFVVHTHATVTAQGKNRAPLPAPPPITIVVGGMMLHLGMGQAETLQLFGTIYDVKAVATAPGSFLIWSKGQPADYIGSVTFADGRLAYASRQWANTNTVNATDYAASVIDALRSMSGESPCAISDAKVPGPDGVGSAFLVKVTCGQRSVEISGGGNAKYASTVSETVRSR
jgi:hypothetical protein